jgi:hypothetical protein
MFNKIIEKVLLWFVAFKSWFRRNDKDEDEYYNFEQLTEGVAACLNAISFLDTMDDALLNERGKQRRRSTNKKATKLLHTYIDLLYKIEFDDDNKDQDG